MTTRNTGLYVALLAAIGIGLISAMAELSRDPGPMTDPTLTTSSPRHPVSVPLPQVRAAPGERMIDSAVAPEWVESVASATGIPPTAVRAYGNATLRLDEELPECRLGWTTLAGIGHVESRHGTIDGRELYEDGWSSTPILGPALDGRGNFAAIRATPDSSRWHGNPRWDHAVGPMQFIPSTWRTWASDGDRDGISDPNDLDDAAYAAARYLCADGHRLDGNDWGRAVFGYNHSEEYVRSVHAAAIHYATRTGSGS